MTYQNCCSWPIMSRGSLLVASFALVMTTLCAFGFMSYYSLNQKYIRSTEKHDQVLMQYDNSVIQIRALEAEKIRVDEKVRREEELSQKKYDELRKTLQSVREQSSYDKKALLDKITSLESQLKKSENDYGKLGESCASCRKDLQTCSTEFEKYKSESSGILNQQKQDCSNNINRLKDEISQLRQSPSVTASSPKPQMKKSMNLEPLEDLLQDAARNQIPEPVREKKNIEQGQEQQKGTESEAYNNVQNLNDLKPEEDLRQGAAQNQI